jgi:hypothetical protein
MIEFKTKANRVNGEKARVCIQRHDLAPYGFGIGCRYNLVVSNDQITMTASTLGERKVSRVTDKRRNVDYSTIDLRLPKDTVQALAAGSENFQVFVDDGVIVIRRDSQ